MGKRSHLKPGPLTINSIGSDDDKDDKSVESEIAEVLPCPSKAGSKLSRGLKHKRSLGEVEVKTEQVRGGEVQKVHCKSFCMVTQYTNHPVPLSVIGAQVWLVPCALWRKG